MKKQEFLKQVKALLNTGEIVRIFKGSDKHGITLWIENPKYIHWQSFGQSAVKNNLKDLSWVIYELYGNSSIVNDYTKNTEYSYKVMSSVYAS